MRPNLYREESGTTSSGYSGKLDFIIIGAQKAGTTSLYRYLGYHPDIFLPYTKEVNFFSLNAQYRMGWDACVREHFSTANRAQQWGIAPPRCMIDDYVPGRIYETFPEIRLVAILRDPIERAVSHYMMSRRREQERRDIERAMREELEPRRAARNRRLPYGRIAETRCYLTWGEYGRILGRYRELFEREQLLLLTLDELSQQPKMAVRRVFRFLGVDEEFVPPNLERVYHAGGLERISTRPLELLKNPMTRWLWRRMPDRLTRSFWFWWETTAIRKGQRVDAGALDVQLQRTLVDYFDPDLQRLATDWSFRPPWQRYPSLQISPE